MVHSAYLLDTLYYPGSCFHGCPCRQPTEKWPIFKSCSYTVKFTEEHAEPEEHFCSKHQQNLSSFPKSSLQCDYGSVYSVMKRIPSGSVCGSCSRVTPEHCQDDQKANPTADHCRSVGHGYIPKAIRYKLWVGWISSARRYLQRSGCVCIIRCEGNVLLHIKLY